MSQTSLNALTMKKDLRISFANIIARVPASMSHFLCLTSGDKEANDTLRVFAAHLQSAEIFFCTMFLMLGLFLQEE